MDVDASVRAARAAAEAAALRKREVMRPAHTALETGARARLVKRTKEALKTADGHVAQLLEQVAETRDVVRVQFDDEGTRALPGARLRAAGPQLEAL